MSAGHSVICLMGPTASGKSGLAMTLAEPLNAEIVSVDSAQVYRGMDIGTAKPSPAEQARVPHHLIDRLDPADAWSAEQFRDDALTAIREIIGRGRTPLLVGGTMLYFRTLLSPMAPLPAADPSLRAGLNARVEAEGLAALYRELVRRDPETAGQLDPNNRQRVLRALEVLALTGRPLSAHWHAAGPMPPPGEVSPDFPWPVLQLGLMPGNRTVLHRRINARFDAMLRDGLVDEVRRLYARQDLSPDLPSMRSVGYRQIWQWLAEGGSQEVMAEKARAATRQLAKRQLTWLRGWRNLKSFDTLDGNLSDRVLNFLHNELPSRCETP